MSAQTKPAPSNHFHRIPWIASDLFVFLECSQKAGENSIRQIMVTQKSLGEYKEKLQELERHLLLERTDFMSVDIQIVECHNKIKHFSEALKRQTAALGLNGHADLRKLSSNAYLQVCNYYQFLMFFPCLHHFL